MIVDGISRRISFECYSKASVTNNTDFSVIINLGIARYFSSRMVIR